MNHERAHGGSEGAGSHEECAPGEHAAFGARLAAAVADRGRLCVGIDPHPRLLEAWGLTDDAGGLEHFALTAVDALAGDVAVLKPQSAFFERYGSRGLAVLERVLSRARHAGALVLLDVKRGDIGSTMAAYAQAYLDDAAPLAADAVTLSPYLGVGALDPALDLAGRTGRGVFVLALTSNPEGATVQRAWTPAGGSVAQQVVDAAAAVNAGAHPQGHAGIVVGATVGPSGLDLGTLNGPVLAPGVGAQGAAVADLPRLFGAAVRHVVPATARDVLRHGPDPVALRSAALRLRDEIAATVG
ncbi:MAG: orotidine-5'-phosphate decarboxylase [Pseudonocardiaceae bacterium]|nr:orotidine-5'-phosphate decarboxylase [Pseudonocardiaceae bacterium]